MTAPDRHDEIAGPEPSNLTYRRQWLYQTHHTASRDYDKALMMIAGGGLGVSIAFIRDVGPHPNMKWLLGAGWLLLALSLLVILIAFVTSQKALLREIGDLDDPAAKPRPDLYAKWTTRLNSVSGGCCVLGVVCVVIFAGYNL